MISKSDLATHVITLYRRSPRLRRWKRAVIMAYLHARAWSWRIRQSALHQTIKLYYSFGRGAVCNICGWEGRAFKADYWHEHVTCPACNSRVRHRLIVAALATCEELSFARLIDGKRVLHFAPERSLEPLFRRRTDDYVTADKLAEGYSYHVDWNVDMTDLSMFSDAAFECVVACDVLEHINGHLQAIAEVYRVLAPGGCAILTVPQQDGLAVTFETPDAVTPEARIHFYGQWDHVRMYGDDFVMLLERAGFSVCTVTSDDFSGLDAKRYVLFPPQLSPDRRAPNSRRVFFAFKQVRSLRDRDGA